ncbi:MAG: ATP-binding cassette domain-containing protein [Bacteroidetes bacterium]|nr:ATP-binding cassette domain-containing protein [Bacteroidota bacterium]
MVQIKLQKVGFGYTDILFEDVDISVTEKDHIGIVGDNGSGKSTLLKCIAGIITDYQGQIVKPKNVKFGFIEQDVPEEIKNLSLYDAIADKIPNDEQDFNLWKVDVALDTFKAPESIRERPIKELSGGWQRMALLARVAMSNPDILLLDEPTNHLDVSKIMVLEDWLKTQVSDIPIIAISHDRRFLDSCTNRTVFLRGGQVSDYKYSYSRARELLLEDDKSLASQRAKELEELERLQKSAHNLRQIGVDNYSAPALMKAKQIEKKAERLKAQLTAVYIAPKRDVKLISSDTHANRLVLIEKVNIVSPDNTLLFHIEKLEIFQGDRLVILGANGSGKSQFIHHLNRAFSNRDLAKKNGIFITPTAKLGYIDQHLSNLPLNKTLKDFICDVVILDQQKATSYLVSIGFPYDTQEMKIKDLSQGQKSRLNLLVLRLIEPNFYIMDEPTNHLDIAGQEGLEREIIEHGASSLLVSHDRAFVANLGTKFYEIYQNNLREIKSPESFYKSFADNDITDKEPELKSKSKRTNYNSEQSNSKELSKLKTDIEKTEKRITEIEKQIKMIEIEMQDSTHSGQLKNQHNSFEKYNELKNELDEEMQKWENLSNELSK